VVRRTVAFLICALILAAGLYVGAAPMGVVTASSDQSAKQKVLYFQNATTSIGAQTYFIMNTTLPATLEVVQEFTDAEIRFRWFLDPPLAGDLILNGTVSAHLWVRFLDAKGAGTTKLTLGLGLYEHKDGSVITILSEDDTANQKIHSFVTSHFSEYDVSGNITSAVTISQGSRLEIVLLLKSNQTVTKRIAWGSSDFRSRLSLPAVTRIRVSEIRAFNSTGGQPVFFDSNDNITFNATILDPFGGYDIVWVNLTLEAPDGTLIFSKEAMTRTTGNDTSYVSTYELNWPATPKVKGSYNVTVEAVDHTGYYYRFPDRPGDETFGGHLESLTVVLAVGKVIWANFLLLDSESDPVAGSIFELWEGTILSARGVSNETGRLNITNVPGAGNYTARAWWQDVIVLEQTVSIPDSINESDPMVLILDIFSPTFQVVDDGLVPLGDASVFVTHPNGTTAVLPITTDAQGMFSLSKTAGGTYTLHITWSGSDVGERDVLVQSNDLHLVFADVFYLRINALANDGQPMESVHIVVTDLSRALIADSKLSDPNGTVISRLPRGLYKVEATWLGARVGSIDSLSLTSNLTVDMSLSVFTVTLSVLDQDGVALEGARVEVTFEGFKAVTMTDSSGKASVRLPGGSLSLKVWWRDVLVFEGTETVDENTTSLRVFALVFYVTVKAVDKDGSPLPGVSLTLYREGLPVDGGITDESGMFVFRQPVGTYQVRARLRTTYLLTDINQTAEATFDLPMDEPEVLVEFREFTVPVTSTNLFFVLIGLAALITVLALLGVKLKRRGGGREIEVEEPPPPE
jgi:hypothetical protein